MNSEKIMKTSFYCSKKSENTENTKNKNTLHFPNKFFIFYVFKNRKQLLKIGTNMP